MKEIFLLILASYCINEAASQSKLEIDSVLEELNSAREDTNKVNKLYWIAYAFQWNDPKKSIEYSLSSLTLSKKLYYSEGELKSLFALGEALAVSGNFTKATEIKLQSLELAERLGNEYFLGAAYQWIASGYFYQGAYDQTISYTRKAISISNFYKSN